MANYSNCRLNALPVLEDSGQCDFSTTSVSCWIITGNMDLLTSVDSLRENTNTGVITTGK